MPAIEREITRFQDFLPQGQKLTQERTSLVREIFSTHYHFEADELLFKMKQKSVKISRATVYRTLELLVKSGLVRRVHLGEDHYHYEHVRGDSHHDHLVCTACGVRDRVQRSRARTAPARNLRAQEIHAHVSQPADPRRLRFLPPERGAACLARSRQMIGEGAMKLRK